MIARKNKFSGRNTITPRSVISPRGRITARMALRSVYPTKTAPAIALTTCVTFMVRTLDPALGW